MTNLRQLAMVAYKETSYYQTINLPNVDIKAL